MPIAVRRHFEAMLKKLEPHLDSYGVRLYDAMDQTVFPIYGENGGLTAKFLVVLMIPGIGPGIRLDGGILPRRDQVFQDADRWIFASIELTENQVSERLEECVSYVETRAKYIAYLRRVAGSSGIGKVGARVVMAAHRIRCKAMAFLAA